MLVVILCSLSALITYIIYINNIHWKVIQKIKWMSIISDIKQINTIYELALEGKIPMLKKGKMKKELIESKKSYEEYLDFCKRNDLVIPKKCTQISSRIINAEDVLDPKKALDRELNRARDDYNDTYNQLSKNGEELYLLREQSKKMIDQCELLINSIAKIHKTFGSEIKQIQVEKEKFKASVDFAKKQEEDLKKSLKAGVAGVATGASVAVGGPTLALWVATTFGTASTGTAISSLSGAAATNAALAWLGGGTLAASGGGIAVGEALLAIIGPIGWTVAGVTIFAGVVSFVTNKIKGEKLKKDEIACIKKATLTLRKTSSDIKQIYLETKALNKALKKQLKECRKYENVHYASLSKEEQYLLGSFVNNVASLSELMNKTVGDQNEKTEDI